MKEVIAAIGITIIAISVIFVGAFVCNYTVSKIECTDIAKQSAVPTRFSWKSGCYIQMKDGRWMPIERFRAITED